MRREISISIRAYWMMNIRRSKAIIHLEMILKMLSGVKLFKLFIVSINSIELNLSEISGEQF